jgi:Cellulase (glycosyl hydrolase family 5)
MRRYADAWRHVARGFRSSNRLLGYDLMNEPWPGTVWQPCASPSGCPAFDTGPLAATTRKATRAIRKVDRRHLAWQEPSVIFNFGPETHLAEDRLAHGLQLPRLLRRQQCAGVPRDGVPGLRQRRRPCCRDRPGPDGDRVRRYPRATEDRPHRRSRGRTHGLLDVVGLLRLRRPDDDRAGQSAGDRQGSQQAAAGLERDPPQARGPTRRSSRGPRRASATTPTRTYSASPTGRRGPTARSWDGASRRASTCPEAITRTATTSTRTARR